jgi:hypothetical protein
MEIHKPVGIWIRVSTEDQVKGESPEHYEKRAVSAGRFLFLLFSFFGFPLQSSILAARA